MIAKCLSRVGGLCGEPNRVPTQAECDDIGEVMCRVGEQGEAIAENPRSDLDDDKSCGQSKRKCEAFGGLAGKVAEMRVVVGLHYLSVFHMVKSHAV